MGFLVVYLITSWRWSVIVSLAIGIAGIVSPRVSGRIEWGWYRLGDLLGFVVRNVVLSGVYMVVLCPLAKLSKLFKKDPLMLSREYGSYFVEVKREYDAKTLEKLW